MRFRQLLSLIEMPIEDFQTIGDFNKSSSFRKPADRRLLTNPKYVERVKNMFAKTDIDFRMFFVNSPEANRHNEIGQVTLEWFQRNMPKTLEQIQQQGGFGPNSFNMVYNSNKGAEWRPMTGWIMAHRMGHVLFGYSSGAPTLRQIEGDVGQMIRNTLETAYSTTIPRTERIFTPGSSARLLINFFQQIGTMKSARERNIRTAFEFLCECLAQYLITGDIKFNPAPQALIVGMTYGRPQYRGVYSETDRDQADGALEYCASMLQNEFDRALHDGVGKIFVM